MTDFSSYDEPREPCCVEEPDHSDYGFPTPDIDAIVESLTPEQTKELTRYALFAAGTIGSDLTWKDYTAQNVTDDLVNGLPDALPPIEGRDHGKPEARWWTDLIGADRSPEVEWTPEED